MAVVAPVIEEKARAAVRLVARQARVRAAYLFGSCIEGTADSWSDIDVAAFIDHADRWDLRRRVGLSVSVREQVGDDVELHLLPAESLANPPRASLAQYVLQHGLPLDIANLSVPSA